MIRIAQVQLLPRNPVRVRAVRTAAEVAKEAGADVEDGEALEEAVAADEIVRDEKVVSLAIGEDLLDAADAFAAGIDDTPSEEQLQLHLILL
jgi:predicted neutral ceramidase superfamily lipid hydrolase